MVKLTCILHVLCSNYYLTQSLISDENLQLNYLLRLIIISFTLQQRLTNKTLIKYSKGECERVLSASWLNTT